MKLCYILFNNKFSVNVLKGSKINKSNCSDCNAIYIGQVGNQSKHTYMLVDF